MNNSIIISVLHDKQGDNFYMGKVSIRDNNNKSLWSKTSDIKRLTRDDAANDAIWLKEELLRGQTI